MRYGPIHVFNLCDRASDQATLFLSTVPRDNAMLPPVVRLSFIPKCKRRPARAAVLSELNTFLNLIEAHMGKPALIRVSRDFDAAYNIGEGINRTLWLERNFLQPDYASRPWVMWTASTNHLTKGIEQPVDWDVVRPCPAATPSCWLPPATPCRMPMRPIDRSPTARRFDIPPRATER